MKMMQKHPKKLIFVMLCLSLCGCQLTKPFPTNMPSVTKTPTHPLRWEAYQKALSKEIVNTEDGVYEWDILGMVGRKVYVWAVCQVRGPIGTAGSVPAVVYLGQDGKIEKVTIPRDGDKYYWEDIETMFPPDVSARIHARDTHGFADMKHLEARQTAYGPPLIVLVGTPLP